MIACYSNSFHEETKIMSHIALEPYPQMTNFVLINTLYSDRMLKTQCQLYHI